MMDGYGIGEGARSENSLSWKIRRKTPCPATMGIAANHGAIQRQREGRVDAGKAHRRHELPVGIQNEAPGSPLVYHYHAPARPSIVLGSCDKSLKRG